MLSATNVSFPYLFCVFHDGSTTTGNTRPGSENHFPSTDTSTVTPPASTPTSRVDTGRSELAGPGEESCAMPPPNVATVAPDPSTKITPGPPAVAFKPTGKLNRKRYDDGPPAPATTTDWSKPSTVRAATAVTP